MSADPQELNRRCAVLSGWTIAPFTGSDGTEVWWERKPCPSWYRDEPPRFTEDPAAALLLVAELRKRGYTVTTQADREGAKWTCALWSLGHQDEPEFERDGTFCLAIVTALLSVQEAGV